MRRRGSDWNGPEVSAVVAHAAAAGTRCLAPMLATLER
jgi:hypothetical protein